MREVSRRQNSQSSYTLLPANRGDSGAAFLPPDSHRLSNVKMAATPQQPDAQKQPDAQSSSAYKTLALSLTPLSIGALAVGINNAVRASTLPTRFDLSVLPPVILLALQCITIFAYGYLVLTFVYDNHHLFARQFDDGGLPVLLEIVLVFLVVFAAYAAPTDIWQFRVLGAAAALFWLARCWVASRSSRLDVNGRKPFLDARNLYAPPMVVLLIAGTLATFVRVGIPSLATNDLDYFFLDIIFTVLPCLLGVIVFLIRLFRRQRKAIELSV
jgi:hypothetical protein